jgi:hypothetical protein
MISARLRRRIREFGYCSTAARRVIRQTAAALSWPTFHLPHQQPFLSPATAGGTFRSLSSDFDHGSKLRTFASKGSSIIKCIATQSLSEQGARIAHLPFLDVTKQ